MKIIGAIITFFLDSIGQTADTEENTTALILVQVIIGFIFVMAGLFWLYYHFM